MPDDRDDPAYQIACDEAQGFEWTGKYGAIRSAIMRAIRKDRQRAVEQERIEATRLHYLRGSELD